MDSHAADWFELVGEINFALLSAKYAGKSVDFGALPSRVRQLFTSHRRNPQ
jgi:hypothetical protein